MAVSFLEDLKSDHGSEIDAVRQSSFRVDEIKNPLSRRNAVSISLNAPLEHNGLGENPGHVRDWRSKYVDSLLNNLEEFPEVFDTSEWKVKLYTHGESLEKLAPGLMKELQEFDFVETHCMANASPLLSPGTLWRFLSLGDQTLEQLLILDIDESWRDDVDQWVRFVANNQQALTRAHHIPRKGFWLDLMNPWGAMGGKVNNYLPIMASKVMARPALLGLHDLDFLMSAYVVLRQHRLAGGYPCTQVADDEPITPHNSPYDGMPYGFGNHWNGYCFDERFLAHVVFHHAVQMGELCTFCLDRFRVDDLEAYLRKYNLRDFLSDYEYVRSAAPGNTFIHRGSNLDFSASATMSESETSDALAAEPIFIAVRPIGNLELPGEVRGIVPDISFHPSGKMFAVTTWAENRILLYGFADAPPVLRQVIHGDVAGFNNAHSIVFTPSADRMIVNSYLDNSFVVFDVDTRDYSVNPVPVQIFKTPGALKTSYPHSMDITRDGRYLACVYCDGDRGLNKIVIYRLDRNRSVFDFGVVAVLEGEHFEYANPKGIAFTPDNLGILTTFSDTHNLVLYDFDPESGQLDVSPRQILRNPESKLAHPEDISFSACGSYFMVCNSGGNNIGSYGYDQQRRIVDIEPVFNFGQPEVALNYPHGLDFSPDGLMLAVTDYGYYEVNQQIVRPLDQPAKVAFYEISHQVGLFERNPSLELASPGCHTRKATD